MVATADTFGFDAAVLERHAPMAAAEEQQAWPPLAVPEGHQILAQDADPFRQIGQVLQQTDRLPIAAHEFAARGARTDMRQFGIFGGNLQSICAPHR